MEACVNALVNVVGKGLMAEISSYQLAPQEVNFLRLCMDMGEECTATQLADYLPIDPARISRIVTRLVDRGLLIRRRIPDDRRVVMLRLSDEGVELTTSIVRAMERYEARLTDSISPDEMAVFRSVTARILTNHSELEG